MADTVTLTIDGREVTVPKGMTILEAARRLQPLARVSSSERAAA